MLFVLTGIRKLTSNRALLRCLWHLGSISQSNLEWLMPADAARSTTVNEATSMALMPSVVAMKFAWKMIME